MLDALKWLAYPTLTLSALAFGWIGVAYGWPAWAIGVVVVVVSAVYVELLERVLPYAAAWSTPTDLGTDVWHNVLSSRACDLGGFAGIALLAPVGSAVWSSIGVTTWPHGWPLAVQGLLALALVELPWYWCHRLEHEWPVLWRIHAVHHSSQRLTWWNLARSHPVDNAVSAFASMGLLGLLGVGAEPLALVAAFAAAHGMLQHSNIDCRTGPLDQVLNTPRVHRWHHSRDPEESNANYGPTLTIWDHVFGTRRFDPAGVPPLDVGLHGSAPFPRSFVGQLRAPFDAELWR